MSVRPMRPCAAPGCTAYVTTGPRCTKHTRETYQQADARKDPARTSLYATARWRRASQLYRASHPLCVACGQLAGLVDHVAPHRGCAALFWDAGNWQSLCWSCHNAKTARERFDASAAIGQDVAHGACAKSGGDMGEPNANQSSQ